ncbi:hypothetical protein ACLB2K_042809 [Fragaria x ananassa]
MWFCNVSDLFEYGPALITITAQLEEIIKHIGECLSFIPPSTFGDQHYAESSVHQSLSNEMQTAHFEAQASKTSEIDKKTLSFRKQPKVEPTETDLYSISFEVSTENPWFLNTPQLIEMLKCTSWISKQKHEDMSGSLTTMPPVGQYLEPMYETFFCPLTNKVMEDPVTIRSGVTFERKAIIEWFENLNGSEQTILCPTTGQKLVSKAFNENIALKTTIEQWKERNEAARIKVACEALSLASSDAMVLEAVKEVQSICRRKPYNNTQVRGVGILPLLVQCLEYKDKDVRSTVLEFLLQLIEDDSESKEIIAEIINIPTLIEMLSSSHQSLRHASLLFLL